MSLTNYDSEVCGKLPIHLTNLIQPYGLLLVVETATERIIQVSENVTDVFGRSPKEMVGTLLADYLDEQSIAELRKRLSGDQNDQIPGTWKLGGDDYLVLVHKKTNMLLIEINKEPQKPGKGATFVQVYQEVKYSMSSIEATETLEATCELTVRELKRISGFDKVMLYRFDADWNGEVLAEACKPGMETYKGYTFPASDIPKQARQLYQHNPYRFIPDINYTPVKLFPVLNSLTHSFTDLSTCNVRSVAAVHIEYLRNMNVVSSMSTRILHHGRLWGLIACHHETPMAIDYKMCSVFEMFSGIVSMKISSFENQSVLKTENFLNRHYAELIESVYKNEDLDKTLLTGDAILNLFSASGAVMTGGNRIVSVGQVPATDQLEELLLWLHTRQLKNVFSTSSLGAEYEYAKDYHDIASGILVVPINYQKDRYLIFFRPEKVQVINWGGNPEERIRFDADKENYHPRNSFKQWQERVRGISLPWNHAEVRFAELLRSFIYEYETSVMS